MSARRLNPKRRSRSALAAERLPKNDHAGWRDRPEPTAATPSPATVTLLPPCRVALGPPGQEEIVELGIGIRRSIARYLATGKLRE